MNQTPPKSVNTERIILGIDPGTNIMGYGLILNKNTKIELIKLDVIKLSKLNDHPLKLKKIFETVLELIDEHHPDELAIEAPFFGKNVQSMLKLGRAQGVSMAAALYRDIPIFEYSPRKIKQSITGNGSASKQQVSAILLSMLKINTAPKYFDATDGLAVAVCHYFQTCLTIRQAGVNTKGPQSKVRSRQKYNGWKGFLAENPQKIK